MATQHEEERGVYVSELTYGGFTRVVPLPPGAITDNAAATFNDGVLEDRGAGTVAGSPPRPPGGDPAGSK